MSEQPPTARNLSNIDRRTLLRGAVATIVPGRCLAQPVRRVNRVALVANAPPVSDMFGPRSGPSWHALAQELSALGYVEGRNLEIVRRSAEGRHERFGEIAAELARLEVDVIVSASDAMTRAAMAATSKIPIVMTVGSDPVAAGLVRSLARPGGNVTGLTFQTGPEIDAKRLELLKAAAPAVSRIAFLASPVEKNWDNPAGASVRAAAPALGVTLLPVELIQRQVEEAFERVRVARAEALFVGRSATAFTLRTPIIDLAKRNRLPSSFDYRDWVEAGGLMSYGANPTDNFRRAAGYVDRILRGAQPAELPVEQPTRYELVLNMRTARAIGLAIATPLRLRADELIE